ncbi:MAG: DUF4114 domain-containing protein, partial [Saprospiraceae bacterium]|nr:DUF4114 domain-containing protein [Saprospiraceae bacterium]
MKALKLSKLWFLLVVTILIVGCVSELSDKFRLQHEGEENFDEIPAENSKYGDFDFETVKEYRIQLRALDLNDAPLQGANVRLYVSNPLDENGNLKDNIDRYQVFNGMTDANGRLISIINPAATYDSLYILPNYIGLPSYYVIPLDHSNIDLVIGGAQNVSQGIQSGEVRSFTTPSVDYHDGYYWLGSVTNNGNIGYLESPDFSIESGFIQDINNMFPSGQSIPNNKPELMDINTDGSLHLTEATGIDLTFVSDNVSSKHSFGYYTYPTNSPPSSANDVTNKTLIFPRLGKISAGNTVKIYYLDPATNQYTATFPTGVSVGWFMIKTGWNKFNKVKNSNIFFSNHKLNQQASSNTDDDDDD